MSRILVIDDDRSVRHLISKAFEDTDIEVLPAATAEEGLRLLGQSPCDAVLLDILLPETSGLEVFERIRTIDAKLPVIFITSLSSSETAIKAMTLGAFDYLLKPLDLARIRDLVRQALEIRRLMSIPVEMPGSRAVHGNGEASVRTDTLVGNSPQMQEVYKAIGRVAPQDVTVLIRGESGTGKELVARALYQHSPRVKGQFLAVNCAAIPDALLESELFGHEKGSFTGADQRRIGKFEQCSGGTLFLDEIGDMSPLVQSKVLRVLQSQQFERVGGNQTITTDVRVIAATNRDLEKMVEEGDFRSDLYYRLSGFTIQLAPLRTARRPASAARELPDHFQQGAAQGRARHLARGDGRADRLLVARQRPRAAERVEAGAAPLGGPGDHPGLPAGKDSGPELSRSGVGAGDPTATDLRHFVDERLENGSTDLYAEALEFMERYLVTRVLRVCDGNQSKAARMLGITRGCLRSKVRSLKVSIDTLVQVEGEPLEV